MLKYGFLNQHQKLLGTSNVKEQNNTIRNIYVSIYDNMYLSQNQILSVTH